MPSVVMSPRGRKSDGISLRAPPASVIAVGTAVVIGAKNASAFRPFRTLVVRLCFFLRASMVVMRAFPSCQLMSF